MHHHYNEDDDTIFGKYRQENKWLFEAGQSQIQDLSFSFFENTKMFLVLL